MIISASTMRLLEQNSTLTNNQLLQQAGNCLYDVILPLLKEKDNVLILCGNGNNGGDGLVLASLLTDFHVQVYMVQGEPKTKELLAIYKKLNPSLFINNIFESIEKADVIIDAIYGIGFHGTIPNTLRPIFHAVNTSRANVYSIDVNSGCIADDIGHDDETIESDITFAIHEEKICHSFNKETSLAKEIRIIDIDIHEHVNEVKEMNVDIFFSLFPKKHKNNYKGTNGIATLIGSSYGMPGALGLNILGAKTVGASYIQAVTTKEVYPIVASHYLTPVFKPFTEGNYQEVVTNSVKNSHAIGFGSGCTNMFHKQDILDIILQNTSCPVVLDAEGIRLLINNYYILNFVKVPLVITPHVGEFAALINKPISYVKSHRVELCKAFSKRYKVYIVLKGTNTIVTSPHGELYINQTGNAALAQAGSGDVLTGMIVSMMTYVNDTFDAICMAVWLHGYLVDIAMDTYAMQNFDLTVLPTISNQLFLSHKY